jgi:hypothetical protein
LEQPGEPITTNSPETDTTAPPTGRFQWWHWGLVTVVMLIVLTAVFGVAHLAPATPADDSLAGKELQVERQIGCPI